ncbi:MAG TPA: ABC transporter substrate-binding protein [Pyrinomonadaceae bacterium]|nr:ABC transporter substrate-binding protein [Pyrinomonadaceae bacterium]
MLKVKHRRFLGLGVLVFLLLSLATCKKPESSAIKIGVISPFTGSGQQYGQIAKNGMSVALEEINAAGGIKGKQLELIYEDDQLNPQLGKSALNKLVNVDKVQAILGPFTSGVTLAVAPDAVREKVVILSPTATNYKLKDAGDFFFRVCPSDNYQGALLARTAYETLGARKVAVLYMNTDYGVGLQQVFTPEFERMGGKVLITEAFPQGGTDFRSQLAKIKQQNPDLIFMPSNYSEAAAILKQAKELGFNTKFLGGDGSYDPELLKLAGNAAESFMLSTMAFGDMSDPVVADFFKNYKRKFNEDPTPFAALWYDGLKVLASALENIPPDSSGQTAYTSSNIQQALRQVKYRGVTGPTEFDQYGEVKKPFTLHVVKGGQFTPMSLAKGAAGD